MVVRQLSTKKEIQELRDFDPSYGGGPMCAVGCMERVIHKIALDRKRWDQAMERYYAKKREYKARRAEWLRDVWWPWKQAQDESPEPVCPLAPPVDPPKKPLHVVVISTSTAKLCVELRPVEIRHPLTHRGQGE